MRKKLSLKNNTKSFKEGYEEFINYCKVRNLRPATIKHYEDIIKYIWSPYFDVNRNIDEINTKTIEGFIIYCKGKGQKDVTINTNIRGVRAILYYFMKLDYLETFKISEIKENKDIIETYTKEEIEILLKKPNIKECAFYEYRNWVICNFLLATGCRAGTLVNIKIKDIDLENGMIYYRHTKNRKQQVVPISGTLQLILNEYISYIGSSVYLFPSVYGEQLKARSLSHTLMNYNRNKGVEKTGCHRWRHTFAKMMILNGADVFRLQKMLGHSDMTIVRNYVNMFAEDLQDDFDKFNPLESVQKDTKKYIKLKE